MREFLKSASTNIVSKLQNCAQQSNNKVTKENIYKFISIVKEHLSTKKALKDFNKLTYSAQEQLRNTNDEDYCKHFLKAIFSFTTQITSLSSRIKKLKDILLARLATRYGVQLTTRRRTYHLSNILSKQYIDIYSNYQKKYNIDIVEVKEFSSKVLKHLQLLTLEILLDKPK